MMWNAWGRGYWPGMLGCCGLGIWLWRSKEVALGRGSVEKCSIWWGRFRDVARPRGWVLGWRGGCLKMFRCICLMCSLVL